VTARSKSLLEHGDRGLGSNVGLGVYLHPFYVCVVLRRKELCDGPNPGPKVPTKYLQTYYYYYIEGDKEIKTQRTIWGQRVYKSVDYRFNLTYPMGPRHHYSFYYYTAISDHIPYRQTIILKGMESVSISFPPEYVTTEKPENCLA
jgi:hypothetical protein